MGGKRGWGWAHLSWALGSHCSWRRVTHRAQLPAHRVRQLDQRSNSTELHPPSCRESKGQAQSQWGHLCQGAVM